MRFYLLSFAVILACTVRGSRRGHALNTKPQPSRGGSQSVTTDQQSRIFWERAGGADSWCIPGPSELGLWGARWRCGLSVHPWASELGALGVKT